METTPMEARETTPYRTLTVQIRPDQEALRTIQAEIQTRRPELTAEAATAYEKSAAEDDEISVEDAEAEYGILRISAPATAFVSALENGEVAAVPPTEYYERCMQQQRLREELEQEMQAEDGTSGD
ncbi:MAG: Lon protease-like protein [Natronomonas sp.]|jgi:Lon protease-like protein